MGGSVITDEDIVRLIWKHIGICIENSDWVCIVNPQVKRDTNVLYMTFKLLKRRYRSTEIDEKLRRLDYFNQPFEEGNDIRLVDDIDMDESKALLSLSAEFDEVDPPKKRGNSHAIERDVLKRGGNDDGKNKAELLFDDFNEHISDNRG